MQHRSVCYLTQFDTLEVRAMMSAGFAHSAVAEGENPKVPALAVPAYLKAQSGMQAHPGVALAAQKFVPVKGTFKGGPTTVLQDDYFVVGNLSGKVGKVEFSGHANGFISGNTLQGGYLDLTNSQGTITASLGEGKFVTKGNTAQVKVSLIFENATGAYGMTAGSAGDITLKFSSAKSHARTAKSNAGTPSVGFSHFDPWLDELLANILLNSPDAWDSIFGDEMV